MATLIPVPEPMAYFAQREGFERLKPRFDDWPLNLTDDIRGFAPDMFAWLDDPDRPGEYFVHLLDFNVMGTGGRRANTLYVYVSDPDLAFEFKMTFC